MFYIKFGNKNDSQLPYTKFKQSFTIPSKKFNKINDTKKILLKHDGKKWLCNTDENGMFIFVICIVFIGIMWCVWMIYKQGDYFKNKLNIYQN